MKKRRWLAALGAAVLTFTAVFTPGAGKVQAAEAGKLVVDAKIGDVTDARVGEEITIPITVSSETAVRGFVGSLKGNYDESVLEYKGFECDVAGLDSSAGGNFGYMVGAAKAFKTAKIDLKFKVLKCSATPVTVTAARFYCSDDKNASEAVNLVSHITITHTDVQTERTEPTCTEDGKIVEICKSCGAVVSETPITKLGHDNGTWVTVADSTFTKTGSMERQCTRDHAVLETKEIPVKKLTASMGNVSAQVGDTISIPVSLESDGNLRGVVGKLKGNYDETVLKYVGATNSIGVDMSLAGGNFGFMTNDPFTKGTINLQFKVLKCSKDPITVKVSNFYVSLGVADGDSEPTEMTSSLTIKHSDVRESVTPATCLEDGRRLVTCESCGAVISDEVLPKLGHDDGQWVTVVKPTLSAMGSAELRCTRDQAVLNTKELPLLCDVNEDGIHTLVDAIQLLDMVTKGGELSADLYDFNGDGVVNITDAIGLLDYITQGR